MDRRGLLRVRDPGRTARQFAMLLAAEARTRSLHGVRPLPADELAAIAADTTDLILDACRP